MARLRQQHPQNYVNSGNIHTDFENVIRYLNAAELGNRTVAELLAILFNEQGVFRGPIQMRADPVSGLQFRVGMYASAEAGWQDLITLGELRGPAGANVGNIEGPFFYNRLDRVVTTGVASITVTDNGTLYESAPAVSFSAPDELDGVRPTAVAVVDAGVVTEITLITAGSGYVTAPTITIAPPADPSGDVATATATLMTLGAPDRVLAYAFDPDTDTVIVYKNGILLSEETSTGGTDYTPNPVANTITLVATPTLGDKITIYSVRTQTVSSYRRVDTDIEAPIATIPFVHTAEERLLVFRNGVLQEEGGDADYLSSSTNNSVTFFEPGGLTPGDKITIITVENQALKRVGGLMFEDEYADSNGFLRFDKISVQDGEIPQSKVSALPATLNLKANIVVSALTPEAATTGDFWLDTSRVPTVMKFYDGTQWLQTSPESSLPTFLVSNAGSYVRVNGTGTALEYGSIDFSTLVPKTFMGAANGVATLDSAGNLPVSQLPETFATASIPFFSVWEDSAATVANKTYFVTRIYKQVVRIDGIAFKLSAGTCNIQLSVDGVAVGPTFAVNTTVQQQELATVIEISATDVSRRIELVVTGIAAAEVLEVSLAVATVNV